MLQRVMSVPEGEDPNEARKKFDNELGVAGWGTPGAPMKAEFDERDPDAPSWWVDDEDASQTFLSSMGVVFQ
jgi:hypothetical protein